MSFRSRLITLVVEPVSHQAGPSKLSRPALAPTLAQLRSYATHKEAPRKNGPSASATAAQEAYVYGTTTGPRVKSTFEGTERVGPFPLGVGSSGRDQTWKSWRELTLGGKLGRTVRQSGNLGIILFGSGLLIVLTLSLTTELFATNSPGVLYSQAVDKIRKSNALNPHLLPPLSFTHSPRAAAPVRGTTPVVHRTVKHPSSGRDHMIITFWVHGRGKDEPERLGWFKDTYASVEQSIKDLAVYAGLIEPSNNTSTSSPSSVVDAAKTPESQAAPAHGGSSNWLSGLFGAVTGRSSSTGSGGLSSSTRGLPPPGTYTVGEVHGDYVKNAAGEYQLLSLIIDIPSSGASYPGRAVVHWSPEADKEGILSKIGSRGR